ncbi:MAG: hypothetical protein SV186_01275 [Candidatus Nanohaloarchaea archaeon]|nr:hypothetical protein [Candidatus Nanohaloarchaea archaeon]
MRKGLTSRFLIRVFVITVLVAATLAGGGPLSEALGIGVKRGYARLDAIRLFSPFVTLQGQGTATMSVTLKNSYDRVELITGGDSPELVLDAEFLENKRSRQLPPSYNYDAADVSGKTLCVEKQGLSFTISKGSCSPISCFSNSCSSRMAGGAPQFGYFCNNGAFTRQGFYPRYYNQCSSPEDSFGQVNRVACPMFNFRGQEFGCMISVTYRCPQDKFAYFTLNSSEGRQYTQEMPCSGRLNHTRVFERSAFSYAGRFDPATKYISGYVAFGGHEVDMDPVIQDMKTLQISAGEVSFFE